MNRAHEALGIEPVYRLPQEWKQLEYGPEFGKHLFRWYIEEDMSLTSLSEKMKLPIDRLIAHLKQCGIVLKENINENRPNRLDVYFRKSLITSERTTCLKAGVGAVLINKSKRDVLYGFNGAPRGDFHCTAVGTCKKDIYGFGPGEGYETCVAVHAEQNVICEAAAGGVETDGCTMLVTRKPCPICYRLIRMARFHYLLYPEPETNLLVGEDLYERRILSNIEVQKLFS